jgi:hypothetical protein
MALCLQEHGVGRRDGQGWLQGVPAFAGMPTVRVGEVVDWVLSEGILFDDEGILWLGRDDAILPDDQTPLAADLLRRGDDDQRGRVVLCGS